MLEDYNSTLNLPKTSFPMRAGLPQLEPQMLKKWEDSRIYEKLQIKNQDKPKYIVHDGPPYANGDIHMGHALNKILKDFVVRYKSMTGFCSPFVPGWDTHGLPTELKARQKAGLESSRDMSTAELRKICKDFVLKYVDDQRNQFKRLGVLADWSNPYITLQKNFEAKQIELFADMADKGYVYRDLKPVYWCSDCKTALAEAEIEYENDTCHSIYVKFKVTSDENKLASMGADLSQTYFVIWTTTAWTLPGNVAVCVGKDFDYSLIKHKDEYYIMAKDLYKKAMEIAEKQDYQVLGSIKGAELEMMKLKHPFLDRESLVIVGDHVTLESGTGCVHTAPGHGVEDYEVCRNYEELQVIVPVDKDGTLTDEAGQFAGLKVGAANKPITQFLEQAGNLFAVEKIDHQYPHCWRCKNPVIFRATEQWFCSIDKFKENALQEIQKVTWVPAWGEDRIAAMVRERKDWCISRQRKWGVPIPVFFCKNCEEPLVDKDLILKIAKIFEEEGSNAWYEKSVAELTNGHELTCKKCSGHEFKKETDIMDVWFDSGSTHLAVCKEREELSFPADLYLEGADQYRGWFQSSLLTCVAFCGKAPYKAVVTHGWVVDGEGRKQSKSLGNGVEPQTVVDKYGADILRLWVSSADYHSDMRISPEILKQLSESYRKIRNTARFILGNLYDFDPEKDKVALDELLPLDKWALSKLNELIERTLSAYDAFEFYQVYHSVYDFCIVDMSNYYLDILKDRLYVEAADSTTRRAAQTAIYLILHSLVKLISPILAFTSEEIWHSLPSEVADCKESILMNSMPSKFDLDIDAQMSELWDNLEGIRSDVTKALELARGNKVIGSSLEAEVELHCEGEAFAKLSENKAILKEIFIVSSVKILNDNDGEMIGEKNKNVAITVKKAPGEKCERCWSYSETVGADKICERCRKILNT
ncbi:MAG: isoleucine--tRNA ligase [Clostridia bacterium]|nr:isoleucine--tRNA ligase [Clostridia bacterium]